MSVKNIDKLIPAEMTPNIKLFAAIEAHFTESAEDRWRRFAVAMIERSSPDITRRISDRER